MFYFHNKVSAKIPTAVQIAQSNMTAKYPTSFGSVTMIGDPLTVGPESNSTIVGRAQGIYGSTDQDKSNGSTLSILGRNAFQKYREMPIVGNVMVLHYSH
uniref:Dirigent protein n=1 Tax=Solanum lycopersicum TaxID=4081 RepID=A0A3Q7IHC7_SOLLC